MNSYKIFPLFANFPRNGFTSQGSAQLRPRVKEGFNSRSREANHG
jgi:hypothetical protein